MNLADILLTIAILLVLVVMIIPATIYIIIIIKCRDLFITYRYKGGNCWGMKPCGHSDCCLRHFCPMYQHAITPEVVSELDNLLEERRRELEMEDKQ